MRRLAAVLLGAVFVCFTVLALKPFRGPVSSGEQPVAPADRSVPVNDGAELQGAMDSLPPVAERYAPLEAKAELVPIAGRVVDQNGSGFRARVRVTNLGGGPADAIHRPVESSRTDGQDGEILITDASGNFATEIVRGQRVQIEPIGLETDSRVRVQRRTGAAAEIWECTAPAINVVLVLPRSPGVSVRVWAQDRSSGINLTQFKVRYQSDFDCAGSQRSVDGVAQLEVPFPPGVFKGSLTVELIEPVWKNRVSASLSLSDGQSTAVTLGLESAVTATGEVVDMNGAPVSGATVFFGTLADGRGDEPFSPFQPERVRGVLTDATGQFSIGGAAGCGQLTVWSPRHASVTVDLEKGDRIVLSPRGRVSAHVGLASRGNTGNALRLDQSQFALIQPNGKAEFDDIDPGLHLLELSGRNPVLLRVHSASTTTLWLDDAAARKSFILLSNSAPLEMPVTGCVFGLGEASGFASFRDAIGAISYSPIDSSPHIVFTDTCAWAELDLGKDQTIAELGSARLTIQSTPGRLVLVLPEQLASSEEVRRLLSRLVRRVPSDGVLTIGPLHKGKYVLFDEIGRIIRRLATEDHDLVIEL